MTTTDPSTPSGDLAALRRDVDKILAELDRRDLEQATVENAIEFLHECSSKLLMVLGQVVKITLGRDHDLFKRLYPNPVGPTPTPPPRRCGSSGRRADGRSSGRRRNCGRCSSSRATSLCRAFPGRRWCVWPGTIG